MSRTSFVQMPDSTITDIPESTLATFPYTAIGKITSVFPGQQGNMHESPGTGFVIAGGFIATCAHNFCSPDYGVVANSSSMAIDPGENFDLFPWRYPVGVTPHNLPGNLEYAVARTDPLQNQVAPIELYPVTDEELQVNSTVWIPGVEALSILAAMAPPGPLLEFTDDQLQYQISTLPGMSGAPVLWTRPDGVAVAIGIHYGGTTQANVGVRLTAQRIAAMTAWIAEMQP